MTLQQIEKELLILRKERRDLKNKPIDTKDNKLPAVERAITTLENQRWEVIRSYARRGKLPEQTEG